MSTPEFSYRLGSLEEIKDLFSKLRRLLYSRGHSGDDTDDLIQEAFLRLQEYHCDHTVRHAEAFLVRTVLNLLTDQRRRSRMVFVSQDAPESLPLIDASPSPDAVCHAQERLRHFKNGLRALSPRRREVFILHRIEGHSFAQIAQQLGITVSMAEKHAARAMLYLGDWMAPKDEEIERGRE